MFDKFLDVASVRSLGGILKTILLFGALLALAVIAFQFGAGAVGSVLMYSSVGVLLVRAWATQIFKERREELRIQEELRPDRVHRVPQPVQSLYRMSAQALDPARAWQYVAKACGMDPKDQSDTERNRAAAMLAKNHPDGLMAPMDAMADRAGLLPLVNAHYAEHAWQSLVQLSGDRFNEPVPRAFLPQVMDRLLQKYPLGLDARAQVLAEKACVLDSIKRAYCNSSIRFLVRHCGVRLESRAVYSIEQEVAGALVERYPGGLEPEMAFHVKNFDERPNRLGTESLTSELRRQYDARKPQRAEPSTTHDRKPLLELER